MRWRWIFLGILAAILAAPGASAQTSRPVAAFESQPIRATSANTPSSTRPAIAKSGDASFLDIRRVAVSLGAVIGLIFALRWVMKRFFPAAAGSRSAGVIRVLSRAPLTPRQHVLLIQVGRRVLVVADNGTQMSPLSEIRDPDEVAHLISELSAPTRREDFNAAIGAAEREYAPQPDADRDGALPMSSIEPSLASTQGELQGLLTKVRELTKQFGR